MQSICSDATCFLFKPCNRLWDLQTIFDHRVVATLALDHVALAWSIGIAVASGALPRPGPHTYRRPRRPREGMPQPCELGRGLV